MPRFNYKWNLSDGYPANGIKYHGLKVFSTFACGGGSSMGYKLAGYDVIGANDIDPQMPKVYKHNHKPKYFFECSITDLKNKDLPKELYDLDILDGSPPCSTFSMAGSREKAWKKDKKFREGQAKQVLSDLFFDWIDLVKELQPKIAIAENVKGMLSGNAKLYTKQIIKELNKAGYETQLFLLNAASMGLPQRRERVFFIAKRKDLKLRELKLSFNERSILFKEIRTNENTRPVTAPSYIKVWQKRRKGDSSFADTNRREFNRPNSFFNLSYIYEDKVLGTIAAADKNVLFDELRYLNDTELMLSGSYPMDYKFLNNRPEYLIGMSVPPIMMANVAYEVYLQLLKDI
jgi:DNA (cytosine-5)-methyltransferase 1